MVGPHIKENKLATQKTKPNTKINGPHTVKSVLVVQAYTVRATTTEAVRTAASTTVYPLNLAAEIATMTDTHHVKMVNKI